MMKYRTLSSSVVALKSIEFHKQHLFTVLLELTLLQRESFEGEARSWLKKRKKKRESMRFEPEISVFDSSGRPSVVLAAKTACCPTQ